MGIFNIFKNYEDKEEIKQIKDEMENFDERKVVSRTKEIDKIFNEYSVFDDDFKQKIIYNACKVDIGGYFDFLRLSDNISEYAKIYKLINNEDLKILQELVLIATQERKDIAKFIPIFINTKDKMLAIDLYRHLINESLNWDDYNKKLHLLYEYYNKSKVYFVNEYMHYTRLKSIIDVNIPYNYTISDFIKAYIDIDMRNAGIYNIDEERLAKLESRFDRISDSIKEQDKLIKRQTDISNSSIKDLNARYNEIDNLIKDGIKKLQNQRKFNQNELEKLTQSLAEKIYKVVGVSPIKKEKLINEVQKSLSVIKYFDKKIPFNERYDIALSNKDKNKYYDKNFDKVLKYVMLGQSVWLAGPTRCGKTYLAEEIAQVLSLNYFNIGRMHDFITQIKGYRDLNNNFIKSMFQEYFENGGIITLEEADLSDSQALAELDHIVGDVGYKSYAFGDNTVVTPHENFRLMATANTRGDDEENGYDRNIQDKSVMKRFTVIDMDYNEELENIMLKSNPELAMFLHNIRKIEREIKKSDMYAKTIDITTGEFRKIKEHIDNGCLNIEEIFNDLLIKDLPNDYLTKLISRIDSISTNTYTNTFKELVKRR